MSSLNYDDFKKKVKELNSLYAPRLQMIESVHAVERDGDRPEVIKLSWRKRLFSWPWRPWVATKTIMVPNYKPAIYRMGDKIIYHPALKEKIKAITYLTHKTRQLEKE